MAIIYNLRAKSPNEKEWQYTFITGSPIEVDSAGKVTKFVGLRQDETNIIKLSKEFAEKNTQLNMVLKAGLISSIIIDVERDLMRITSDDILTTNNRRTIFNDEWTPLEDVFKIIHPDDRILLQKSLELLKKGELSTLREEIRIDPDGEYLDSYEANFIVLNYDKKEIPKTIIGYIQNITENKLLLSDLRRAKEQAEQSNKLKSAFLANMSHEIRTPLNAIVGFSELITEVDSATERNEYIKIIKNNNELLLRLIGDILDLSKIEAGMIEMKPEKFDLSRDFEDAYITLKQKCNNPKIEFLHVNPYVSCEVYLDRNRLLQIITNYATNAIKYTIKGSITMSYEVVDHGVKITVSDTGIGVAEEKKHKLFQRFEKLDDFAQGTGLGLSIVKALTEVAGGNVGFETEEGIGSTFWAWIPTESVVVEKKKSLDLVLKSICDRNEKQIDLDESAKKVLIADDSDSNYLVLARLMQGYKIDRAGNGLEAIDKAKAGGYDIIMMDIRMPEIDGFTATSIIREFDDLVPIIAITANASDSDRIKALEAGCNAFVSKPINKRDLDDAINAVFNSSQQG